MYDRLRDLAFDFEYDEIPDTDNAPDESSTLCSSCDGEGYTCDEQDPTDGRCILVRCSNCDATGVENNQTS